MGDIKIDGNNSGITNCGNHNIITQILYQRLGEDTNKEIVEQLASQIIAHFDSIHQKLDNLSNNKEISDYLLK